MLNFLLSTLLYLTPIINSSHTFEGIIKLVQKSHYDTTYFTYLVKNENIRIDKYDSEQTLIQSLLVNLENEEIYILSPAKKLYTKLELSDKLEPTSENFVIQKTQNSRIVNNYECYQWRVKNVERNTEIAYWVWQNDFYFFEELVSLLNQTDKTYEFFEKIPDSQGFFPILTIERTLLRREKLRIYVVDINKKTVDETIFNIPDDFEIIGS